MKYKDLFEMPERIAQQEVQFPWSKVNTKEKLWMTKLKSTPDGLLVCHPMVGSSAQQAIVAYLPTEKGRRAVAGMLVHTSNSSGQTYVEVGGVTVSGKHRGKGLAYDMYVTMAFSKGLNVVSDDVQTPGGASIWRRLAQQFPENVGVTDEEVDDAVALDQWKDGDPFTHHFTRFVLSPAGFVRRQQTA